MRYLKFISSCTTRAGGAVILMMLAAGAPVADTHPPLREVKEIDDRMFAIALAIEISDRCGSIAPRTVQGLLKLNSLRSVAKRMGYSDKEIRAYVRSDAEKARLRKRGEDYVQSQGLDPTSDADLCTLGRTEIGKCAQSKESKCSLTGSLLKEK